MKQIITLFLVIAFSTFAKAQSVISVVPNTGQIGQQLTVSLTGDDNIFYFASTTDNISFTNQFSNFLPINQVIYIDENNVEVTITIPTDAVPGQYNVNVFNNAAGVSSSIPFAFRVNTLGINPFLYQSLSIAPNPINESFNLMISDEVADNAHCYIYDVQGRQVFKYKIKSKTTNINIQKLVKGNYILEVINGAKKTSKKLLKL